MDHDTTNVKMGLFVVMAIQGWYIWLDSWVGSTFCLVLLGLMDLQIARLAEQVGMVVEHLK